MSEIDFTITTKRLKLSDLIEPDYNPRIKIHDDPEFYEYLYNSLTRLKYIDPIIVNVINEKNVIINGNQRVTVMKDMAEEKGIKPADVNVDVVAVEFDELEEMTANTTLNNVHGEFVPQQLRENARHISKMDEELAKLLGFNDKELETLISPIEVPEEAEVKKAFKIHISIPSEYKSYYDIYRTTHSQEELTKEVVNVIVGEKVGKRDS